MRPLLSLLPLSFALASAAAQAPPQRRVTFLAGAGTGSTPDLTSRRLDERAPALTAALGIRVRPAAHVVIDGTVHQIGSVLLGDDVAILPIYTPGVTYRQRGSIAPGSDAFATADVRAGIERPAYGLLARVVAGAGYMWEVSRPYAVIAAGLGTAGDGARLTLDLEHRRFRTPIEEFTVTESARSTPIVTRTFKASTHATFVRLGVELPLIR